MNFNKMYRKGVLPVLCTRTTELPTYHTVVQRVDQRMRSEKNNDIV